MSEQKISAIVRQALWLAHQKKCAYTRELVDLENMHVDHVLPEYLVHREQELATLKATLRLDETFNLLGLENLLPAKAGTNLQKSGDTFDPERARYYLGLAASKKPKVEQFIEEINKKIETGRAMVILRQLIEGGHLTHDHLPALLTGSRKEIFKLAGGLGFADLPTVDSVSKSEIDTLKNKPLRMGANDHIDSVTLTRDKGDATEAIKVRTCLEYEDALKAGYYPLTTFDIKMAVFFEHQCGLLSALSKAVLPTRSYISEPRVGLPDLHLLPFTVFPNIADGDGPERAEPLVSYQDKIDAGELTVKRAGSMLLNVESEGFGQHLVEIVRADFDGDGLEDILVYEYHYATQGTFGAGGILLLSRNSPDGMFEQKAV